MCSEPGGHSGSSRAVRLHATSQISASRNGKNWATVDVIRYAPRNGSAMSVTTDPTPENTPINIVNRSRSWSDDKNCKTSWSVSTRYAKTIDAAIAVSTA